MPIDTTDIQDFTYANMLAAAKQAVMHLMIGGQNYTINGRVYTKADLGKLQDFIDWCEGKIEEEDVAEDGGGGEAIVVFGERTGPGRSWF
jgi:hypothetical protein